MFFDSRSSSSSSSSRCGWSYDVFLSFRGIDTRKNFTGHLYTALVQAGIHTFRDDDELPRGKEISPQLLKAIQESRISIVVFSKGYASSRWCLNELVEILECRRNKAQTVLPIFYDIDPSNVRKQSGSFKEAFDRHEESFKEEMEKVNRWREALKEVGNLSGLGLKDEANGQESEFIKKIVREVSNQLDRKYLSVPAHIVGINSLVHDIIGMLSVATDDVRIVGIHGMAGIGKTTIAKAVFNQLSNEFDGSCFLENVGEKSKQTNGLVQLQRGLLCDILKQNVRRFNFVDKGVNLIKERFCHKRVLIILDDVDQQEQLHALIGNRSWFGPGSGIIITSRDEHLLNLIEVDVKFQPKEMDQDTSLQLFSWHAFRDTHPKEDYMDLSKTITKYAGGVPLALEVLGSYLFKRRVPAWKSAIEKLQKIPHPEILKKLRISFDSLDDDKVKGLFLDIACFFIGWDKDYVTKILDGRGFFPDIGVDLLIDRSLLAINDWNEFDMHNLLRDMGREIIREKAMDNPGSQSRIWSREDALDLLNKNTGTEVVEGLALDVRASVALSLSMASFTNMRCLKLLQINGAHLVGSYEHLSKDLIWLCWLECSLQYLPSSFPLDNIIVLDMQSSNLKELWKEAKTLNKLKILNLSHSNYLTKTPNFCRLFNLERLILEECPSLINVHPSIGHLRRLVFLNLEGCCRLKILPESMGALQSLETMNIRMCSKIEKLPERLGDMESLTELLAHGTAIKELPPSIGYLRNLKKLSLSGFDESQDLPSTSLFSLISLRLSPRHPNSKAFLPAAFYGLSSLIELDLSYRGLSEGVISNMDLGSVSSLQKLHLSGNKFFNLPSGIGCLPKLHTLSIDHNPNLVSIPLLPSSLMNLVANGCTSLERVSIEPKHPSAISILGCQNLKEIEGIEGVPIKFTLLLGECDNLSSTSKQRIVQALSRDAMSNIIFRGGEVPEWFSHISGGERSSWSVSFKAPNPVSDGLLRGLLVWVVCTRGGEGRPITTRGFVTMKNKSKGTLLLEYSGISITTNDWTRHSWVSRAVLSGLYDHETHRVEAGDELELSVKIKPEERTDIIFGVEKVGVHLIVGKPDKSDDNEESHGRSSSGRSSSSKAIIPYRHPPLPSGSVDGLMNELQQPQICTGNTTRCVFTELVESIWGILGSETIDVSPFPFRQEQTEFLVPVQQTKQKGLNPTSVRISTHLSQILAKMFWSFQMYSVPAIFLFFIFLSFLFFQYFFNF